MIGKMAQSDIELRNANAAVLVIGAGVSGLTSALILKARGFNVTVVAENFAPHVTSVVAGALWEWPPAVCGMHHEQATLNRSKEWCRVSYRRFANLSCDPTTGVFMRTRCSYGSGTLRFGNSCRSTARTKGS